HPSPAPALVEGPVVHVGASAVWDLGWCVHILHDQHFWGCPFLEDRLAGGKHRCDPGLAPGVLRHPCGPHHRAVWHWRRRAWRDRQRWRLLHDLFSPRWADGRHCRTAVCVWT
ncbi:hypothetical protein STEG23_025591, partial [Scotinomys teguina]